MAELFFQELATLVWADVPTDLWAIQPTGRETTDFKKAVSVRVK
jgi:hypothetical protein